MRTSVRGLDGSDYGRFRHALDSGNLTVALAAAAGLEYVGLAEALELLLLISTSSLRGFRGPRSAGMAGTAMTSATST
jgi:hypothetical protein